MPAPREAGEILDRDFLETRAKILEIAASLDRLDRSPGRLARIRQALEVLLVPEPGRAETIQRIFSREYDPNWRSALEVDAAR